MMNRGVRPRLGDVRNGSLANFRAGIDDVWNTES